MFDFIKYHLVHVCMYSIVVEQTLCDIIGVAFGILYFLIYQVSFIFCIIPCNVEWFVFIGHSVFNKHVQHIFIDHILRRICHLTVQC